MKNPYAVLAVALLVAVTLSLLSQGVPVSGYEFGPSSKTTCYNNSGPGGLVPAVVRDDLSTRERFGWPFVVSDSHSCFDKGRAVEVWEWSFLANTIIYFVVISAAGHAVRRFRVHHNE